MQLSSQLLCRCQRLSDNMLTENASAACAAAEPRLQTDGAAGCPCAPCLAGSAACRALLQWTQAAGTESSRLTLSARKPRCNPQLSSGRYLEQHVKPPGRPPALAALLRATHLATPGPDRQLHPVIGGEEVVITVLQQHCTSWHLIPDLGADASSCCSGSLQATVRTTLQHQCRWHSELKLLQQLPLRCCQLTPAADVHQTHSLRCYLSARLELLARQ